MAITIILTEQDAIDFLNYKDQCPREDISTTVDESADTLPNVPTAPLAPSTAAADPLPIAPEDPLVILVTPTVAFAPPAATSIPAPPTAIPTPPVSVVPPPPPVPAASAVTESSGATTSLSQATTVPSASLSNLPPPIVPIAPKLDKDGLPWDARIHSGNEGLNQDGTWRMKRGVEKDFAARVIAELRAVMALGSPQLLLPGVPPAPMPTFAPVPPPPPPPTVVPQPADSSAITFPVLINRISQGIAAGTLTPDTVDAALERIGLPPKSTPLLGARPDIIPTFAALLGIK